MVKYSCHVHLTGTIREVAKPLNYPVTVMPAGAEHRCGATTKDGNICGKPALWVVAKF